MDVLFATISVCSSSYAGLIAMIGFMFALGMVAEMSLNPKQEYKGVNAQYNEIHWSHTWNPRHDYGDVDDLTLSFLKEAGWDSQFPPIIETLTAEEIEKVVKPDLNAAFQRLQREANKDKATEFDKRKFAKFQELFMKGDEFVIPKYRGNTGNRRSEAYLDALVRRELHNEEVKAGKTDKTALGPIPDFPTFIFCQMPLSGRFVDAHGRADSKAAAEIRWDVTHKENNLKTIGAKEYSNADRLFQVQQEVFEFGRTENYIRNHIGVGSSTGVQLYKIVFLDNKFGDLEIIWNLTHPLLADKSANPKFVDIKDCKYTDLQTLCIRLGDKSELDEYNKGKDANKQVAPATSVDVYNYFYPHDGVGPDCIVGRKNAPKSMTRESMEKAKGNSGNAIVKKVLDAVLNDKIKELPGPGERYLTLCTNVLYGDPKISEKELEACWILMAHVQRGAISAIDVVANLGLGRPDPTKPAVPASEEVENGGSTVAVAEGTDAGKVEEQKAKQTKSHK